LIKHVFSNTQKMHQIIIIASVSQMLKTINPYEMNPVTSKKNDRIVITSIGSTIENRYFFDTFTPYTQAPYY
ncbi:MAG: hypothetical protein J7463_16960, partial [Roseiflexus sp.]|nr:hypothetical protein [Roseiflexus sp.]